MKLHEYLERHPERLRQATLVLLVREGEILLAMKKRGIGQGRWNGVGGKPQEGADIIAAARREAEEEIGVEIEEMSEAGRLSFYFVHTPEWNQEVVVYRTGSWKGEPVESEEMAPRWFKFEEIPYEEMWPDDKYWLPMVLENKRVKAKFLFGDKDVVEEMEVEEVEKFT